MANRWISRLVLKNFKGYREQEFRFPKPENGKNIILIGGLNGFGKTSLLEAIYLCLYGKNGIPYLGRAGIQETQYKPFLEKALNAAALKQKKLSISVSVEFNEGISSGVRITRLWYFKDNGDYHEEEVLIYNIKNGKDIPTASDQLESLLDQKFVPAHLAPFFFFDGEEVKKLAEQTKTEQIKMGMEGLLGVVLLRDLDKRLREYQANRGQEVSSVDEAKYRDMEESLRNNETRRDDLISEKDSLEKNLNELKSKRDELLQRLTAHTPSGSVANMKTLIAEQAHIQDRYKDIEERFDQIISSKLPFQLASVEVRNKLFQQIKAEAERLKWENNKAGLEPQKIKFHRNVFDIDEPPIIPSLSSAQLETLQVRIDNAWKKLFFPPPSGCAEEIIHGYLRPDQSATLIEMQKKIFIGANEIRALIEERSSLSKKMKAVEDSISRIEGIEKDGTLDRLRSELSVINNQISKHEQKYGECRNQLDALLATVKSDKAIFEREHQKYINAQPTKSLNKKAERVRQLIQELIPGLYQLKIKKLDKAISTIYASLAHKQMISKITLDEEGNVGFYGSDGDKFNYDRSAGENQLFATALIGGLAQISGVNAPLVVDTPLGRLDSKHRANILQYWIANQDRQVILLSQDREIDTTTYKGLKKNISKTYLLRHEIISTDTGHSWAEENKYFEGNI